MDSEGLHQVLAHLRRLASDSERLTDRQLLDRFLSVRDEAAFTALVQRHGAMVYGVARRMLRDPHAAEDVFQATFLILASKAQTIRQQESLSSWLYGVAQRLAARVRQQGNRWESDARCGAHMTQDNPEEVVTQRELETVLDEELKELSDRFRAPLVLCYLEGQTQDEAARHLGWSKATLRRRLERGRELLRSRLLRRGVTLSVGLLTTALVSRVEAGVLPSLVQKTAVAAMQAALGTANAVSPNVAALAAWGIQTMGATRKLLVFWLMVSVLTASGGVAAYAITQYNPEKPPVVAPTDPTLLVDASKEKRASLSSVWSAVYSPDGLTLATGSGNADEPGTLALWDVPTGKARLWLEQPRGVRSVVFSPDGRRVAAAGWDEVVRIYSVRTGKVQAVLRGHSAAINSLAFLPDNRTLISASLDSTIVLWDIDKETEVRRLTGHNDWVMAVALFPDGKSLASVSKDSTLRVWDLETGNQRRMMKVGAPIECVAVSPDGKTVATGGWDHTVRLWDVEKGQARVLFGDFGMGVLCVAFSPDGRTLASVTGNFNKPTLPGEVKLWSLADNKEIATLKGHSSSIWSVRFSPDGRTLVTASRDQKVKLWEAATAQERLSIENGLELFDAKRAAPLTSEELDDIWKTLAVLDGVPAQRALGRLVRAPEQAVPWLAERLQAEPKADAVQEKRIAELIAQLDDDNFETRENATAELAKRGESAKLAMRKALAGAPSAELRYRLGGLLERLRKPANNPDLLRGLRVLEALELMNTTEARQLLHQLADGAPDASLTKEAAASYRRLTKRP